VVETLRDGSWLALQSGGLVHGDLITLDDNQVRRSAAPTSTALIL
jgi:hypothetical protein